MVFHNFDELIAHVKGQPSRARMAVAAAGDAHTIEAVLRARAEGIVTPILVGDKAVIDQVLAELGEHIPAEDIHDEPDLAEAARKAVALVRAGEADFLMKGKLDTSVLLKAVVNKETGLGKGGVMSHFTAFEIPTYHKLLMPVDGGMVTYPTLEQKKAIIENTVGALRAMGYDCPKVGVLACVEKLNPKMPETVEGDALKQMNQRGELTGCVVEGPISYDCAVSREIAAFKGFESPCAGDCDVLVAPNIHAGNIMGKMLTVTCKAKMAGFIVGAPVLRLQGDYLAIVTLAFGEIIKELVTCLIVGHDENGLHILFNLTGNKTVEDLGLSDTGIAIIKGAQGTASVKTIASFTAGFILVMVTLFIVLNLKHSRAGRAIMALRDNRIATSSIGINTTKYKLMAFVTSAALAGSAGALYGLNYSSLQAAKFNFNTSILVLVFVVLGGLGNIWGSLVAAAALTILPEALREFADYRMLVYAIVLILVMLATNNPTFKVFFSRFRRGGSRKSTGKEAM